MKREYSKQAEKFLLSQNRKTRESIIAAVKELPAGDVRKMSGRKDTYRLRIGGFRIIFIIKSSNIYVEKIDNRGQAYKH